MAETRKLAAILAADVVGYSRLAGAEEDRTLARLRGLRSDLVDPAIAAHHGRVVKRTGDGALVEFRSVVDAVRCAIEVQNGMVERNAGLPPERKIEFRVGIHLGDVVEEADGDLMGDGVNIAARIEGIADPGGISLSHAAYEQVRDKVAQNFVDRGEQSLKNIARPIRVYALARADATPGKPGPPHLSIVVLPFTNIGGDPEQDYFVDGVTESLTTDLSRIAGSFVIARNTAFTYKGKPNDVSRSAANSTSAMCSKAQCSAAATACGSMSSSSTPKPAIICGPNGSTSPWPIFSTCRTKSSRGWRGSSTPNSPPPRRGAPSERPIPMR
jgi:adenylate cyclase